MMDTVSVSAEARASVVGVKLVAEYQREGMTVPKSEDLPVMALAAQVQYPGPLMERDRGLAMEVLDRPWVEGCITANIVVEEQVGRGTTFVNQSPNYLRRSSPGFSQP